MAAERTAEDPQHHRWLHGRPTSGADHYSPALRFRHAAATLHWHRDLPGGFERQAHLAWRPRSRAARYRPGGPRRPSLRSPRLRGSQLPGRQLARIALLLGLRQRLPLPALGAGEALLAEVAAELVELGRLDAVDVLRFGEVAGPDLFAIARHRLDHRLVDLGVALDELRHVAGGDPQEVVEDEHLTVGPGAGADPNRRHLELLDDLVADRRGSRLDHDREAADRLQREGVLELLDRTLGRLALGFVAAEGGGGLGGEADVAHHRDAGVDDRPGALDDDAAGLELDRLATGLLDQALGAADRFLVARLVAAHRHVADHQRRLQAAADGFAEHHHLVHRDHLGPGIAEDNVGGGIADEDDVDAGGLGHGGRGVVIGRDHHDR